MKKTKVVALIVMVLNVALLVVLIVAVANIALSKKPDAVVDSSSGAASLPSSSQLPDGKGMPDATLDAWVLHMKDLAQKHSVNALFLQELFPQQIVYKHRGEIVYAAVDDALPKHSYNWENFAPITPPEGEWKHEITPYTVPMAYTDPTAAQTGIFGIDVSKYQGDIDWQAVKDAGVQYVFIRAGYRGYGNGEIKPDEYFEDYMQGATEVGLPIGVYFFSQAITTAEAVEEADYVLQAIAPYKVTWPVVFDMEEIEDTGARTREISPALATDIALAFCEKVAAAGKTPMIYGNVSWLLARTELPRLEAYDLWIAQYRPFPWYPYQFNLWQYSHVGRLPGIKGDVDFNISFKDYGAA